MWGNGANPQDHISVDALWDMLTSNVYMHRLRNRAVLDRAIAEACTEGAFGYASGYQTDGYQNSASASRRTPPARCCSPNATRACWSAPRWRIWPRK